jgi:hypothetical protein
MDNLRPTYRGDEQLWAMLDETADWIVSDADGSILSHVASLRDALSKAEEHTAAEEVVRSVARLAPTAIIVFAAQIDRVATLIDERRNALTQRLRETGN